MDFNKIEHFIAVAQAGSISKATRVLGLSQPALTLQIQALENSLGFKLFERHNRGLLLTEEGKVLLERARVLQDWKRETKDVLEELNEPNGKITVGTYTTASSYLLVPSMRPFFETYPRITLRFLYPSTDEVIGGVKSLAIDCAVLSETPDDPLLENTPFFRSEMIYVTHQNSNLKSIKPSELSDYPFLSYPVRMDYCYRQIEQRFGKYLKDSAIPIESESFDTLKNALIAGIGNSFMPKYIVQNELKSGVLREVKIKNSSAPVTFSFVTRKGRRLPRRIEVFKEFLASMEE